MDAALIPRIDVEEARRKVGAGEAFSSAPMATT